MPDKPRAFRAPDALYESAADLADRRDLSKPRGEREGISGILRLALEAYAANPVLFELSCRRIIEGKS